MSPPANAAAIAMVLAKIDTDPGTIATTSQQDSFLKSLTSKYKFRYYSSTYGHTCHDEKSLRSVLTAAVRNHGQAGEDIRPGKTAVDELFERGSKMLEDDYMSAIKDAAEGVKVEVDPDSDEGEEESDIDQKLVDFVEAQSESDDEYLPTATRRTRSTNKRRCVNNPPHVADQPSKATCINSGIEGCSAETSTSNSSTLSDRSHDVSCQSSSSGTSSIIGGRGQKRSLSIAACLEKEDPVATSSAVRKSVPKSVDTNVREAVITSTRGRGVGDGTLTQIDGRDQIEQNVMTSQTVEWRMIKQDGLLPIKLLAVAAIAALL